MPATAREKTPGPRLPAPSAASTRRAICRRLHFSAILDSAGKISLSNTASISQAHLLLGHTRVAARCLSLDCVSAPGAAWVR